MKIFVINDNGVGDYCGGGVFHSVHGTRQEAEAELIKHSVWDCLEIEEHEIPPPHIYTVCDNRIFGINRMYYSLEHARSDYPELDEVDTDWPEVKVYKEYPR